MKKSRVWEEILIAVGMIAAIILFFWAIDDGFARRKGYSMPYQADRTYKKSQEY